MKRLYTYLIALSLLPQTISAASPLIGRTKGTFAVSPKGAATYTIPLTILKGMNDFKPELSLYYDSQAGDGIMGLGWSIKGMHTISTVSKCQYFDGTKQGTAFALDGMRLLESTAPNGQLYYRTEHDRGDSISLIQNGQMPLFQVKSMDGSIYKYGSSTGKYSDGRTNLWALDYAQDALGNYISYTYGQDGGLYPTSITYGRNIHGTAGVDCVISFTYETSTPRRLKSIVCKYGTSTYRSYTFNYDEDTPTRLVSVTEGGRSVYKYAPTTFGWETSNDPNVPQRIISITDGLGATESFVYGNLDDNTYSKATDMNPYSNDTNISILGNGDKSVIISRTESISTDARTTNYKYYHGIQHKGGKGFLGFLKITGTNQDTNLRTITDYKFNNTFYILIPNGYTQENDFDTNIPIHNFKIIDTYINKVDEHIYKTTAADTCTSTAEGGYCMCHYNSYTNGLLRYHMEDDGFLEVYNDIVEFWTSPIDTIRIKGLPSKIKSRRKNDDFIFETRIYERDPHTGLILKAIKKRGKRDNEREQDIACTDGYSYNEYGQVTRHWTVAYNSKDTLVTTYEYNTKGQLTKENTPLGQYKTYTYNTATGMLAEVHGVNSAGTAYTYDNMLREIKRENNLILTNRTWKRADYGDAAYAITVTNIGQAPVTTYYDAWDRKVAESTKHACVTTYTDYKYLPNGKVGFVSFPHKKTETDTLGTAYIYDEDTYLLTETRDSNGKINSWDYGSSKISSFVTSNIDSVTTTREYLSCDKYYEVYTGNGDNVHYETNADGNPLKIKCRFDRYEDPIEKKYEYDKCGRLIRITDENGKTKEYTYDDNGYPKKVSIGKSYVETNYDKFGRLLSKTWKEDKESPHTVTYTYNTETTKKHLVAQEQGENYTYTYTWDKYGKLIAKRHSITSDAQTEYADMDILYTGKWLRHKTYLTGLNSSRSVTESFGYNNNQLRADSLNGTPIWCISSQDNWGNVVSATGFRGTTKYTFDDYGHTLSMERNSYSPINKTYTYNLHTNNMISKDGEHFTYDNMNRLTGWGNDTYEYDNKGNITHQPSVGDFEYDDFRLKDMTEAPDFYCDESLKISYYQALGRPQSIENKHYKAEFSYDGNGDRILMKVYKKVSGQYQPYITRYYLSENAEINVDSVGNRTGFFYANGDAQTASNIMVVKPNNNFTHWRVFRDNTGSIFRYENSNNNYYDFSYTPWGVRTQLDYNVNMQMPGTNLEDCPFYRTYKGYEDLWMFGLLFDKTRLYNPYQGRYLSPSTVYTLGDAFEQNPYVFMKNNPLR